MVMMIMIEMIVQSIIMTTITIMLIMTLKGAI